MGKRHCLCPSCVRGQTKNGPLAGPCDSQTIGKRYFSLLYGLFCNRPAEFERPTARLFPPACGEGNDRNNHRYYRYFPGHDQLRSRLVDTNPNKD